MVPLLAALVAATPPARAGAAGVPAQLQYETYAAGLPVMHLDVQVAVGDAGYRLHMTYHTIGLASLFSDGHDDSDVRGAFLGLQAAPERFADRGHWHGADRQTVIDYPDGQPAIRSLVPPPDTEREPVPLAMQAGTIDSLSAIAMLIRRVAADGRCEAQARIFDGRRASIIAARTAGPDTLPMSSRTRYSGPALRCDFEGRQTGGFLRDADQASLRRVQHGSAWFAQVVAGAPPLPVRLEFETRWFGTTTMYLTDARVGAPAE